MNVKPSKPRYSRSLTIEELAALPDETIDYSDIPELGPEFWKGATVSFGLAPAKTSVTIRFDAEVIDWFKANASKNGTPGRGYQTAMNAVLKAYVKAQKG
jgi:uncharacterized protein (DUF4415 family)